MKSRKLSESYRHWFRFGALFLVGRELFSHARSGYFNRIARLVLMNLKEEKIMNGL